MSTWEIILKYDHEFFIWFKEIALALRPSCCLLPPLWPFQSPLPISVTSGSMNSKPPFKHHVSVANIFNIFTNLSLSHTHTSLLKMSGEGKWDKGGGWQEANNLDIFLLHFSLSLVSGLLQVWGVMAGVHLLGWNHLKLSMDLRALLSFTQKEREKTWNEGRNGTRQGGRKEGIVGGSSTKSRSVLIPVFVCCMFHMGQMLHTAVSPWRRLNPGPAAVWATSLEWKRNTSNWFLALHYLIHHQEQ